MRGSRWVSEAAVAAALAVVAQINPPPTAALLTVLPNYELVATIENHFASGGLGSMIAEIIADHGLGCRLHRFGASGEINGRSGSAQFMHELTGISVNQIVNSVLCDLASGKCQVQ